MNRNLYELAHVLEVLRRLGYSRWDGTQTVALFNHRTNGTEIIMDLDYPQLPSSIIERKVSDMEIKEEYFDSLYDAEVNSQPRPN